MSVQYNNFYAQRIKKEMQAKDHHEKIVHLHQQMKMANTLASGFSNQTNTTNNDIVRSKVTANQQSTISNYTREGRPPLYFFSTSNATNTCDPNTLRDTGKVRNVQYQFDDVTDQMARNVTWKQLHEGDEHLEEMADQYSQKQSHMRQRRRDSSDSQFLSAQNTIRSMTDKSKTASKYERLANIFQPNRPEPKASDRNAADQR